MKTLLFTDPATLLPAGGVFRMPGVTNATELEAAWVAALESMGIDTCGAEPPAIDNPCGDAAAFAAALPEPIDGDAIECVVGEDAPAVEPVRVPTSAILGFVAPERVRTPAVSGFVAPERVRTPAMSGFVAHIGSMRHDVRLREGAEIAPRAVPAAETAPESRAVHRPDAGDTPLPTARSASVRAGMHDGPTAFSVSSAVVQPASAVDEADGRRLLEALGDRISFQVRQGVRHAVVRLDSLVGGAVTIEMRHEAGVVEVRLSANQADVVRQLQAISEGLRHELGARQFHVVTVQVSQRGEHESDGRQPGRDRHPGRQDAEPGHALWLADGDGAFELALR
ncbi:flagellar hook-length control protein FliK [Burkholderia semiarida]|uniref:Flagellar hook-length control protein FliK n=1 Tax=Burkholderia semiarida TaxID=2843303 RepID=A0ABW7L944_9BURK